jgi:hypothetical protein
VNSSVIGKACGAALPALFGSFAHLASAGDGAQRLSNAVNQQGTNFLDEFSHALSGSRQQDLANDGLDSLTSLLGNSSVASLAGAIGKFAGLGQNTTSSFLGMMTPMLLGVLGKQFPSGVNPAGLTRLLSSQKDNIAAALPSGFKSLLQTPEFSKLSMADQFSQRPDYQVPPSREAEARPAWDNLRWVVPILILGAIIWGISTAFHNRGNETTEQAANTGAPLPETVAVNGVDLKSATQNALDGVKATLRQVNDAASAQAALPKLQTASTQLGNVIQLSKQLPEAGKRSLGTVVAAAQPETTQLFDKVQGIPAANNVTKPAIDTLKAQIDTLSKAA